MNLRHRYQEKLSSIPLPGGNGCHPTLLSIANLGVLSGLGSDQIFLDIRQAIPQGSRKVSDKEIADAVNKALSNHQGGIFTPRPRPKPVLQDGKATLQKIIGQGKFSDEVDLWEASPIRLFNESQDDPVFFLSTAYKQDDLIFIGSHDEAGIIGKTIRTASAWITFFKNGGKTAPHIIINPLNGIPALTKSADKETLRGDGNVASYRYCLVEFDTLNREEQIKFWSAVKLPIVALIDSGGKSTHAWIDVQKLATVTTPEQWQAQIKGRLYDQILTPLGVDGACSNPARLSRLPGHFRTEKRKFQRLLWLSSKGTPICPIC